MEGISELLVLLLLFASPILSEMIGEFTCKTQTVVEQGFMSIRSHRKPSGEWETTITTGDQFQNSPNTTFVDFKRRVYECDGKEFVRTITTIRGFRNEKRDRLLFYETGGRNAVLSKDRRTAMRKNEKEQDGSGGFITNRPLWKDEIFEVRLDKHINKFKDSLGIGVTYHSPQNMDFMETMLCGTIILYDIRIFENGEITNPNYGSDLQNLRVGDRVGVTRRSDGDLRFFVNGVDLGVAKSNVNYQVHGVLDLRGGAVQATIV